MGVSYLKIVGERIRTEAQIGNQLRSLYATEWISHSFANKYGQPIGRVFRGHLRRCPVGSRSQELASLGGIWRSWIPIHLLTTKTITTSIIYAVADLSAQKKIFWAVYGLANATVFFSYNAALIGSGPKSGEIRDEVVARLNRDLLPTLKTRLMYWPICDFATYKFITVHLQLSIASSLLCILIR